MGLYLFALIFGLYYGSTAPLGTIYSLQMGAPAPAWRSPCRATRSRPRPARYPWPSPRPLRDEIRQQSFSLK